MANKRGAFFGVYLVLVVLMCFAAIALTEYQSRKLENSLVSPKAILELEDEKEFFEISEAQFINLSMTEGSPGAIKDKFCGYFSMPEQKTFRDFLFSNLSFEGRTEWEEALFSPEAQKNFCMNIYDFDIQEGVLKVKRKQLGKSFLLISDRSKINFPVKVEYNFEKEYNLKI